MGRTIYVCCGLGKTGTCSLRDAMKTLGFTVFHDNSRGQKRYRENVDKGHPPLYGFPQADFYADKPFDFNFMEVDCAYDNVKLIYTTRELESWIESKKRQHSWTSKRERGWRRLHDYHNKMVQEWVKTKNYLHLDITAEGDDDLWSKLCEFTGKEKPNKPFPHSNRKK